MNLQITPKPIRILHKLYDHAASVADPMLTVPSYLPEKPRGKVIVVGAGKASARMAEAVETVWGACEGIIITRYGYGRPTKGIQIIEASHPVPDENGVIATKKFWI